MLFATSAIDRPESRCRLTAWSLYSWVKLRRVATRFPPLAISGSHNGCLQDRVRSTSPRTRAVVRPRSDRVQAVRRQVAPGHNGTGREQTSRSEQVSSPTTAGPVTGSGVVRLLA